MGKVCMDRNSKDCYQHSLKQNLADTEALVRHVRLHPQPFHPDNSQTAPALSEQTTFLHTKF